MPILKILDKQLPELPQEVKFCKKCVVSNQRPRIHFDEEGVCGACAYAEIKEQQTNWEEREKELINTQILLIRGFKTETKNSVAEITRYNKRIETTFSH